MNTTVDRDATHPCHPLYFTDYLSEVVEATPASAHARVRDEIGGGRRRILVVDDNDTNLEIVDAYLLDSGYHVHCVSSGLAAIQSLNDDHFDLILMDIQMPVMDGVTATRRIRALSTPAGDIPIVAMTGNVLPQQVRSYLEAGMNGHVAKPIDRMQLRDNINRWLPKSGDCRMSVAVKLSDFEGATLDDFVSVVGAEKAKKIAGEFMQRLSEAFQSTFATAQREAHGLINVAGVLGFEGLVAACRCIMETTDTDETGRESMKNLQKARLVALQMYTKRLLPKLFGAPQPPPLSA